MMFICLLCSSARSSISSYRTNNLSSYILSNIILSSFRGPICVRACVCWWCGTKNQFTLSKHDVVAEKMKSFKRTTLRFCLSFFVFSWQWVGVCVCWLSAIPCAYQIVGIQFKTLKAGLGCSQLISRAIGAPHFTLPPEVNEFLFNPQPKFFEWLSRRFIYVQPEFPSIWWNYIQHFPFSNRHFQVFALLLPWLVLRRWEKRPWPG